MTMDTQAFSSWLDILMRARKSVRSFLPDPVPRQQLVEIIEAAGTAPSTFNTQPWRVHLLAGEAKRGLSAAIADMHVANPVAFSPFPQPVPDDLIRRQADFGNRCLVAVNVHRADVEGRSKLRNRNYLFYDAPIGMIFTIDRTLTKHSWLDCGLFLQNLMLAARARGLATCPQVSFVPYQAVISDYLELSPTESVVCGMALGYADEKAPINQVVMPREPLEVYSRWLGFEDESAPQPGNV
jgi:nitroreductase